MFQEFIWFAFYKSEGAGSPPTRLIDVTAGHSLVNDVNTYILASKKGLVGSKSNYISYRLKALLPNGKSRYLTPDQCSALTKTPKIYWR